MKSIKDPRSPVSTQMIRVVQLRLLRLVLKQSVSGDVNKKIDVTMSWNHIQLGIGK